MAFKIVRVSDDSLPEVNKPSIEPLDEDYSEAALVAWRSQADLANAVPHNVTTVTIEFDDSSIGNI